MFFMEYLMYSVLVLVVFSVVVLSFAVVPYHGVVSLMGTSFLCCMIMVVIGHTYAALVMYIVYLGGLIVVFGYCVSVEKGGEMVVGVSGLWYFLLAVGVGLVMYMLMGILGGVQGLLAYTNWEGWVCLEVNGYGVFYFHGGLGLVVCAWALVVALFSILVVLGWTCKGGVRPF
uniref:NADH dehydrogenase subunit 6 n=1 Tax=Vipera berus TaxID=31155 RepID=A0A343SWD6_VIPBE|nr:NADH dehydrogenase subunit 6 [Vipera berus]YP_010263866.1 NADH dehydrogenase subunit 6 [Echis carinatus]YP_010263879.1 NADH dehydrogenase subunit 6 [Echis coloratus]YP_010384468.1 NADH dehydrogenase subunit 6 [Echis omanensis]AUT77202.1 NADH dehydrogenase subunit 6 [Vipera berus]QHI42780.1 NADH dehydrogenase subunit 6 [Vipera berus]QHI42831.1 NADH dehydrogenase subunit 6 [Vipera berus]UGW52627.1 NADH dehydrogenase subunit 6 [Echis carinatus]UGW52640.1 NADH dehydrogenase subunit 6 [Echis 